MNTKTWTILCVVLWMDMLAGSWPGAAQADDASERSPEQSEFQPGDNIVTHQPTALRAGAETLASLPPGTHLVVAKVNPPWLAARLQEDGRTVAGWISITAVSRVVTNSIGMKLAPIPAGEFMMGSAEAAEDVAQAFKDHGGPPPSEFEDEHPQHRVRITRPFHLSVHEVTVGQFRQFVEQSGYRTDAEKGTNFEGAFGFDPETGELGESEEYSWRKVGDEHPVVNVSWNDAVALCKWLSDKEGKLYRLPTEAEWEYACRASTTTRYYHGDDPEGLAAVANVADATAKAKFSDWDWAITAQDRYVFAAPVGKFKPNAFGLYDMHGNVYEWCADWYGEDYYARSPVDAPPGPAEGFDRVYRGGSWASSAGSCRAACRRTDEPAGRSLVLGFRVALGSAE
jgi:formylglycine-generating enzyme required for sulfatase activity